MLAALPHLASIKFGLDFAEPSDPGKNNVANDASFRHERDSEFLLRWA